MPWPELDSQKKIGMYHFESQDRFSSLPLGGYRHIYYITTIRKLKELDSIKVKSSIQCTVRIII